MSRALLCFVLQLVGLAWMAAMLPCRLLDEEWVDRFEAIDSLCCIGSRWPLLVLGDT